MVKAGALLVWRGHRVFAPAAIFVLFSLFAAFAPLAFGDELTVDRRSIHADETVTIILKLQGDFAGNNQIDLPVRNLQIEGDPSESSEFSWINGAVTRRKTLQYTARPLGQGAALVGPAVVTAENGQKETLPPVSLQVIPDEVAGSNDPRTILRELLATNRPPSFIVIRTDKSVAYEGEQVIVTWMLYNAASVQRWQIESVPRLEDFWSEDLDVKGESPVEENVDGVTMQVVPVRRVALFPLHAGTYGIGGLKVSAAVLRRDNDSPFSLFEGSITEVRVPSPAVEIGVRPIPPGPPVDLVGNVGIECSTPVQKQGGPVTFGIGLRGAANLRSAPAPHFDGKIDGESEIESMSFDIDRHRDGATMRRRWRIVVFPNHAGAMAIPPMVLDIFNPATGRRERLRCPGWTMQVTASAPPAAAPPAGGSATVAAVKEKAASVGRWAVILMVLGIVVLAVLAAARRGMRHRGAIRALTRDASPAEVRERVAKMLHAKGIELAALAREASDRGDAYRALASLLDSLERDRLHPDEARDELAQRLRDFVRALER